LGLNRSTLYYEEKPVDIDEIDLLNTIRDIWERHPFFGYRKITKELRENYKLAVNRKRVQRLMVWGGIKAIHPGPNTSKRNKQHAIHPYLLKDTSITRPNQAWMVDITYLRMPSGFMYLVAIIDVYSRYIVGWSLSNTLDTEFCLEALRSALKFETPEIINSDQGCQFTSEDWIEFLRGWGIRISMTGKGRCADNIFIERFWRSLKREEVYLNEYASVKELKEAIEAYIEFYNEERWHQALGYKRPAEVYFAEERKACGYVDESCGAANALRDVGTN
jgi:putative transposase